MRHRRVSMNDVLDMLRKKVEELFADPEKVIHRLLIEGNPRSDSGVHEQIIAATNPRFQALHEEPMSFRKCAAEALMNIRNACIAIGARNHAIGNQCFETSELQPGGERARIVKKSLHQFFVIPPQAY